MSELTDLEIIKRIAEIEGEYNKSDDSFVCSRGALYFGDGANHYEYNPLTDDGLCFRLMVKYQLNFEQVITNNGEFVTYEVMWRDGQFYKSLANESPNKAICLAITNRSE